MEYHSHDCSNCTHMHRLYGYQEKNIKYFSFQLESNNRLELISWLVHSLDYIDYIILYL